MSFYDECNYDFHLTDKLTEGKWITQISKREMEWIIDNTYQLPYHMSGTIRKAVPVLKLLIPAHNFINSMMKITGISSIL